MNYEHAATILLASLRRHMRSFKLTINAMREEIEEHRFEDTFRFDLSSSLVCDEVDVSTNINHNNTNVDRYFSETQLSAC